MKKLLINLYNQRGLTLIELMVAITMAVLIIIPIYDTLLMGNRVQQNAFGQVKLQEKAERVLHQLVAGQGQGTNQVGGLRQAVKVTHNPAGIAFTTTNRGNYRLVTYYWQPSSQQLLYRVENWSKDANPTVRPVGGTVELANVQSFAIAQTNGLYAITITVDNPPVNGGSKQITVRTAVKPRNLDLLQADNGKNDHSQPGSKD